MGRFEKRPDDNPRVRGELPRAAETALWAVVEDLESLQQNVLRSFQEEIKKLQGEKERLTDEIQQLIDEKEHLQEVRRITEQQVLIRQLSEALAKHICSQLQSTLAKIASQTESQIAALKSVQSIAPATENQQQMEKMLATLDDNLTITFNSLQQELKNYQTNLSQQLSRMYSQQQESETIVEDLITRLRGELTKAIQETSHATKPQLSPPTVLQPPDIQPQPASGVVFNSLPTVLQVPEQPQTNLPKSTPAEVPTSSQSTIIKPDVPASLPVVPLPSTEPNQTESLAPLTFSESETKLPPTSEKSTEPLSVIGAELSEEEIQFPPITQTPPEPILSDPGESSSKLETSHEPIFQNQIESSPTPQVPPDDTFFLSPDLPETGSVSPPPPPISRRGSTSSTGRSRRSSNLSPIQVGFLLVVLSTVLSSVYNVAIKGMFYKVSQTPGGVEIAGLISPTLGNIMLILTLRLMVVVPLMVLLAPIMYPQVWQDLQNFRASLGINQRRNQSGNRSQPQRTVQLMLASGGFLFLSQVLIYLSLGQVSTGVAIALFFIYPLIGGLFSWLLLRDRPSVFRIVAIAAIFCGELLVISGTTTAGLTNNPLGMVIAVLAGAAFAIYLLLMRACAGNIHPVSLTLINFVTMLALSFILLMLPLPENWNLVVDPSKLLEIVLTAFILGVLTLLSYVFNHIGITKLGSLRAAIIGASVPILTVIFSGLMLQENLTIPQVVGVLFVTFGAAAFSTGKLPSPNQTAKAQN